MKIILLVLHLLVICRLGWSQTDSLTDDILTTGKYEEGLYRSFESFLKNAPDITTGYRIIEDSGAYERYRIVDGRNRPVTTVYGFSDGEDLFVSARIYSDASYYVRLRLLGPISYFEDKEGKHNAVKANKRNFLMMYGIIGYAAVSIGKGAKDTDNPGWLIYLGDNDGQAYLFDQKNLLSIFKLTNRPMYDRLKAEKDKYNVGMLMQYVDEFNKLPLKKNTR